MPFRRPRGSNQKNDPPEFDPHTALPRDRECRGGRGARTFGGGAKFIFFPPERSLCPERPFRPRTGHGSFTYSVEGKALFIPIASPGAEE